MRIVSILSPLLINCVGTTTLVDKYTTVKVTEDFPWAYLVAQAVDMMFVLYYFSPIKL